MGLRGKPVIGGGSRDAALPPPPTEWLRTTFLSQSPRVLFGNVVELGLSTATSFSVSIGFQMISNQSNEHIGIFGNAHQPQLEYAFMLREERFSEDVIFRRYDGAGATDAQCTVPRPDVGVFMQIVAVWDGAFIHLHVNDQEQRDVPSTSPMGEQSQLRRFATPGFGGNTPNQPGANANFTDLAIWVNRALTRQEALDLIARTKTARSMNPTHGWLFDGDETAYVGEDGELRDGATFEPYAPNFP